MTMKNAELKSLILALHNDTERSLQMKQWSFENVLKSISNKPKAVEWAKGYWEFLGHFTGTVVEGTKAANQYMSEMRAMEIFKTYIKSPEFKQIIHDIVFEGLKSDPLRCSETNSGQYVPPKLVSELDDKALSELDELRIQTFQEMMLSAQKDYT